MAWERVSCFFIRAAGGKVLVGAEGLEPHKRSDPHGCDRSAGWGNENSRIDRESWWARRGSNPISAATLTDVTEALGGETKTPGLTGSPGGRGGARTPDLTDVNRAL